MINLLRQSAPSLCLSFMECIKNPMSSEHGINSRVYSAVYAVKVALHRIILCAYFLFVNPAM